MNDFLLNHELPIRPGALFGVSAGMGFWEILAPAQQRWLIPDMHRIDHATQADEASSNFGFNPSRRARLLGSFHPQTLLGHTGLQIVLEHIHDPQCTIHLLRMPPLRFQSDNGRYAVNCHDWGKG